MVLTRREIETFELLSIAGPVSVKWLFHFPHLWEETCRFALGHFSPFILARLLRHRRSKSGDDDTEDLILSPILAQLEQNHVQLTTT